jgi:ubiquinone/menaquinone biosynthesis C-methylase UbiE
VLEDTGERLIPAVHQELIGHAEHLTRYLAALDACRGKVVLDIASGSGYGSFELAKAAKQVTGVDISEDAVAYAKQTYPAANLEFLVGSGTAIPLPDDAVDVVVTFETIEHIEDYRLFLKEIRRVLRPGGLAIVSTPNELEYEENNHFHLHEFEREELKQELLADCPYIEEYFQATWKYVALDRLDALGQDSVRKTLNLAPLEPEQLRYFYFLCSDVPVTAAIAPLAALGEHYSEKATIQVQLERASLERELADLRGSRTYRLAQRLGRLRHPFRR